MKKIIMYLAVLATIILPFGVMAKESKYLGETYKTLNFEEALEQEGIAKEYEDYKETDKQATIYLFRGQGCGYCQKFLTFMSSIANEYGGYFKIVSFEVWNDSKNAELMNNVATFLNQPAGGVPFIVIGEKAFLGFDEAAYGEGIKTAIKELYDTSAKKRYDVFAEMKKNPDKWKNNGSEGSSTPEKVSSKPATLIVVLLNFVFTAIATIIILFFTNKKFKKLERKIDAPKLEKKVEKKEEPKKKK